MQNKEIMFLNENHIFEGIQRGTFLNNYLKYFSREEFVLGNLIFEEEKVLDKIYFVKEGKIELSLNTNFLSLNQYANCQPKYFIENLKKKQHYSIFMLGRKRYNRTRRSEIRF